MTTLNVNEWTLSEDNDTCHIFAHRCQRNHCWQYIKLNYFIYVHVLGQASSLPPITFNKSILHPTRCARNLGVLFDNQLTLTDHINSICRAASFGLYKIGSIRRNLDQSATERLIHAFVMSRIDNCNGLLYGLSDLLLGRLQRIQNSAARLRPSFHDLTETRASQ